MKIEDENHTGRYFSGHSAAFPNAAQKEILHYVVHIVSGAVLQACEILRSDRILKKKGQEVSVASRV
jgi:hypothetical protein